MKAIVLALAPWLMFAQGTPADYVRAQGLRERYQNLVVNAPGPVTWIAGANRFWYRKSVKGGYEFVLADAQTLTKAPAFDHAKLAASLGAKYRAETLPFQSFDFVDHESAITFAAEGSMWRCTLSDYSCRKTGPAPQGFGRGGRGPDAGDDPPAEFGNDVEDGMTMDSPQQGRGGRGVTGPAAVRASPNGQWGALIENYNVFLRKKEAAEAIPLSYEGSEGNYYTLQSLRWSPDSKYLVAYRVRPGYKREVHYIESSPADQVQPKYSSREYAKPGDTLDIAQPVLFEVAAGRTGIHCGADRRDGDE